MLIEESINFWFSKNIWSCDFGGNVGGGPDAKDGLNGGGGCPKGIGGGGPGGWFGWNLGGDGGGGNISGSILYLGGAFGGLDIISTNNII